MCVETATRRRVSDSNQRDVIVRPDRKDKAIMIACATLRLDNTMSVIPAFENTPIYYYIALLFDGIVTHACDRRSAWPSATRSRPG